MLALAYDAALRREELCLLATDDLDPAHRTLRVRAETTKTRRGRVVPYSAVAGQLLAGYLGIAARSPARGARCSCRSRRATGRRRSRRGRGRRWSARSRSARALPAFSTHTLRHLCLTDLARSGWELHQIATFAGHQRDGDDAALHPPVRPRSRRPARARDDADPRGADRADRRGARMTALAAARSTRRSRGGRRRCSTAALRPPAAAEPRAERAARLAS